MVYEIDSRMNGRVSEDRRSPVEHHIEQIPVGQWPTVGTAVIAFIGKGGVGKSTLAISVAVALSKDVQVTLVDLDSDNCSGVRWMTIRAQAGVDPIPTIAPEPGEAVEQALMRAHDRALADERFHILIVDLPGRPRRDVPDMIFSKLTLAYLPLEPTLIVAGASRRLLEGYRADGPAGPILRPIVNRVRGDQRKAQAIKMIGEEIAAPVGIREYVAHRDAYEEGLGVTEYDPEHAAASDIRSLVADLRGVLRAISSRSHSKCMSDRQSADHREDA